MILWRLKVLLGIKICFYYFQERMLTYRILHECSCIIEFIKHVGEKHLIKFSPTLLINSIIQEHEFRIRARFYLSYDSTIAQLFSHQYIKRSLLQNVIRPFSGHRPRPPPQGKFCTLWFSETALYKEQNDTLALWRLGRYRVTAMLPTSPLKQ